MHAPVPDFPERLQFLVDRRRTNRPEVLPIGDIATLPGISVGLHVGEADRPDRLVLAHDPVEVPFVDRLRVEGRSLIGRQAIPRRGE